jgi:hypothetical protein
MSRQSSGAASSAAEKPVLLEAINLTFRTMERRTRLYRNLVICVSLTLLGSLALAVVFRKWIILLGLLAPPFYVGCFVYVDSRTLRAWRDRVLAMQNERSLEVEQLKKLLSDLRHIPAATLQSMFATLNIEAPKK